MSKGRKRKKYQRGNHQSPKLDNVAKYRSGWELRYMLWLDENPAVVSYSYESFAIPYISNKQTLKVRKYYPDLLVHFVDGTKKLIEIKPLRKVNQLINKKKLAAAQEWCRDHGVTLEIVTEVTLKGLGIL